MKVLAWRNRQGSLMQVFTLPASPALLPDTAAAPPGPDPQALRQVGAKGPAASWEQHAAALEASPPYAGTWKVHDVPDGLTLQQALSHVRREHARTTLTT